MWDEIDDLCLKVMLLDNHKPGEDIEQLRAYYDKNLETSDVRAFIAQLLYRVGIVGLKTESFKPLSWSHSGLETVSAAEITDKTVLTVHKMFW